MLYLIVFINLSPCPSSPKLFLPLQPFFISIFPQYSTDQIMRLDTEVPSKKTKCKQENDDQPTTGLDLLPREIALDILSRLPISSLLQLRFSCRSWQILSQDPHLPQLQFSRTAKKNPCLIFHCEYPLRNQLHFVEFSDQDQENGIVRKIQTPFCSVMPEFNVIGSCNGLLCLSDSLYSDPIYVYNPFTRENRELPKSRQFDDQEVVFGFGFHPVTNEYKLVKVIHYWNGYRRFRFRDHTQSEVQVLSLNTNNWRSIGKVPYPLDPRSAEALVNGRLHWLTQPRRCPGVRHSRGIVSFDLADEQFREIPRPDCGSLNRTNYHLAVLGGCLSAIVCCHYEKFEIWVMKDYDVKESWIKEFKIKDCSLQFMKPQLRRPYGIWKHSFRRRIAQVLCLLENGNILIEYKGGILVSHDPISGTFKKLVFQGMPGLFQTVVHVGSLNWIDTHLITTTN